MHTKYTRLNVSYLALVSNRCASQREGFVFFSGCYVFFSYISVMSLLELCSHSGEITLHCWGVRNSSTAKSRSFFFVPHPCDVCCIEFVARLFSAQWKMFPQALLTFTETCGLLSGGGGGGGGGGYSLI